MAEQEESPLAEATESLEELFSRDPLGWSALDFDRAIAEERRMAEEWKKAEALSTTKRGRPKPQSAEEIKSLEDIGL